METEKQRRVIEKKKEMNEERVVQKKKEATAAISLMLAQYERICADEESKKGLLIVHAFYGKFGDDEGESWTDDKEKVS